MTRIWWESAVCWAAPTVVRVQPQRWIFNRTCFPCHCICRRNRLPMLIIKKLICYLQFTFCSPHSLHRISQVQKLDCQLPDRLLFLFRDRWTPFSNSLSKLTALEGVLAFNSITPEKQAMKKREVPGTIRWALQLSKTKFSLLQIQVHILFLSHQRETQDVHCQFRLSEKLVPNL